MTPRIDDERFPEWQPFLDAVQKRGPDTGTWCEAWTVRDIVIHQAGNAEELARVLGGHLAGEPVATRRFEEREAPLRAMNDDDLWAALHRNMAHLNEVAEAADALPADTDVAWTGRTMKVPWFAEHMREELVLHSWDITGDNAAAQAQLAQPWMTSTACGRWASRCWSRAPSGCGPASASRRGCGSRASTMWWCGRTPTAPRSSCPISTARPPWKPIPPQGFCCCGAADRPTPHHRVTCRPLGRRSMYHTFDPQCQTQSGGIEQFEMGNIYRSHPLFFGTFRGGLAGRQKLLASVLGGVGRRQQSKRLAGF